MAAEEVRIGELRVLPVVTSRFRLDGGSMFGVIPRTLWSRQAPADDLNRIELCVNTLIVTTGDQTLLVEPGMGQKYSEKQKEIYSLDETETAAALASAGVKVSDVDMVIPTHLHLDHAGGSTEWDEAGASENLFPGAVFVVQEAEWEAALRPGAIEKGSYNPQDFLPLEAEGRLKFVSGDEDVAPGVSVELTGGHTRGHQVVRLSSGGEEGLFLGDIVPTTAHLKPNWLMAWDMEPQVVYDAKVRLLDDAAARGVICFFAHDPRIAGCRIESTRKGSFQVVQGTVIEAL